MLSNNPGTLILVAVFAIGAVFFTVGTVMVRRSQRIEAANPSMLEPAAESAPWTAELAGTNEVLARELRIDMVERLAMIGEPWCAQLLERARSHDPDRSVRDAADNALLLIAARR